MVLFGDIHGKQGIDKGFTEHRRQNKKSFKDSHVHFLGDFGLVFSPKQTESELY